MSPTRPMNLANEGSALDIAQMCMCVAVTSVWLADQRLLSVLLLLKSVVVAVDCSDGEGDKLPRGDNRMTLGYHFILDSSVEPICQTLRD